MDISVYFPIFTQKISKAIWDNYICTIKIWKKQIVAIIHIYCARTIFDYFVMTKNLDLINEENK